MNLQEYSTWLIEFSNKYEIKEENKLTVYIAGLIEELNEYNLADDELSKKKELGDLLAYLVLTLNKIGFPLLAINNKLESPLSVSELSMKTAGFLKRLYRGDNEITDCLFILLGYHDFIVDVLITLNMTIEELIEINVAKLNRLVINNTLLGNGNDR